MAHEFRATGKHDNSKAGNAVKAERNLFKSQLQNKAAIAGFCSEKRSQTSFVRSFSSQSSSYAAFFSNIT